jgi:chemotaxis protein MotB
MNKNRETPIIIIVKKKSHGTAHHGGAWKVAFADFMTAMFALFLVLWIVNQSTDIRSAVAGYFQDPLGRADEFGSSIMPGEGAQSSTVRPLTPAEVIDLRRNRLGALAQHLESQLDELTDLGAARDKIEMQLTSDGLRIQLLEDSTGVFFDTGSAAPNPRGVQILALLGRELGSLPNAVRIEGYTDARPYPGSSTYSNWELSADRANAARRVLGRNGLGPDQVVQIRGLADHELRDPAHPYSASNRRITITMLMEYARPPGTRSLNNLPPDSTARDRRPPSPGTST